METTTLWLLYSPLAVDLLQDESRVAIAWFTLNQMLANPEKFQAIFINRVANDTEIEIDGIKIVIFKRPRKTTRGPFELKTEFRNPYSAHMF